MTNTFFILQDTMDEFFQYSSRGERGTLYHSKVYFGHKAVSSKVMANFQHVYDLVEV